MANIHNMTDLWDNAGTTYKAIEMNVTDTASNAASLLMDLQTTVSGVTTSKFNVNKSGHIRATASATAYLFQDDIATWSFSTIGNGGVPQVSIKPYSFQVNSTGVFGFCASTNSNGSVDLILTRRGAANLRFGAADVAAPVPQLLSVQSVVAGTSNTAGAAFTITGSQGTGNAAGGSLIFQVAPAAGAGSVQNALSTFLEATSARVFNLYGTYTDASNYERLSLAYTASSDYAISAEEAGTGSFRSLTFITYGNATATFESETLKLASNGRLAWTSTGTSRGTADTILVRDDANKLALRNGANAQTLRIYNTFTDVSNYERAEMRWNTDRFEICFGKGGSGSLRDIGVFAGAVLRLGGGGNGTTQWQIDANGHFLAGTDNLYDIGASGATRPRNVYVAGTMAVGNTATFTGAIVASTTINFLNGATFVRAAAGSADGCLLLRDDAATSFNRIQLGGTTSSFPALKRSTTFLQARLADDSAFTNIQGKLTTDTAYTAGAVVVTGYLTLYDSTGTAYRVPCLV